MKTKLPLLIGVCLTALTLSAAPGLMAKGKQSPAPEAAASAPPAETAKPPRAIPFHGKVASVDTRAKTFTITGKTSSRVFKITKTTEIMKGGGSATMAEIMADEEVRGSYWKKSDGSLEAKKVTIGPKSEMEKSTKKEKKSDLAEPSATP